MSSEKRPAKDTGNSYDIINDNAARMADEFSKAQIQLSQSASNLQQECIQMCKSVAQNSFNTQKQIMASLNIPPSNPFMDRVAKQSTATTDNVLRSATIFNQLLINTTDAAKENVKLYNRSLVAATDFGTNMMRAWISLFSPQQFFRTTS
jgi:hypothetical protein